MSELPSLSFLSGLIDLPWWGYVLVALVLTHITIAAVTIFLHRHQAHRALDLHPVVSHFFRFWLWLTTGMVTKEWTAIHRKHHAKCEVEGDPHSPQIFGINKVLWEGSELYRTEARNQETLTKFGHGTPDDWIERNLYTPRTRLGIFAMLGINLVLFGPIGITIWAVQMIWIPLFAAGVINGIGHYWGYRNFESSDTSRNVFPLGILIGGEELHNNHHAYGTSAKLSSKWYEFDIGWLYIKLLSYVRLATVRKVAPKAKFDWAKAQADLETLQAVMTHRYAILKSYAGVAKATCREELQRLRERAASGELKIDLKHWRPIKRWLNSDASTLPAADRGHFENALNTSRTLHTLYSMRQELISLWERSHESREQLLHRLQDWCSRADASGIPSLRNFARQLRAYA